ncbi:MAG: hypothetical protein DHS20C14_19680 [Phycisphaeraceae bacterium]|nr:MAG: hypothetical protein DHS20C14_19680 [Phycisphaeraceae bacterium]
MPESPDPLFFLHIPKTAGTSLTALLEQRFHEREIMPRTFFGKNALYVTPDEAAARADEARQFRLIRGHFGGPIREKLFADRTSVTVLREPRARVVSLYNDWRTKSDENLAGAPPAERELAAAARELDLGKFLASGHALIGRLFENAQARQLAGFLWSSDAADGPAACEALDRFDVVGTTELLAPTAALLCRKMCWGPPESVARANAARASATLDDLDEPARAHLDRLTRVDQAVYAHAQRRLAGLLAEGLRDEATDPADRVFVPQDRAETDMLGPLDGSGWHVREGLDTDRPWRWTGPDREATCRLPLAPGRAYTLRVWVVSVIAPDILDGAHLTVAGRSLPVERAAVEGQTVLSAHLPAWLVTPNGPTMLSVLVPRTMSHAEVEPETADTRPKGLAITRISAEPA